MGRQYHINGNQHDKNEVEDALESYVREGARQMLVVALEEEVSAFLGRNRYERKKRIEGLSERLSAGSRGNGRAVTGGGTGATGSECA